MLFDIMMSNMSVGVKIIEVFACLIALLSAIVCHEVAHGYIAYKNGDLTAKFAGRLTLNPVKHFDLFGFLMLATVGFGWAKPVPVDSRNFTNYKKGMVMVSLAGVVTNLILATIGAILLSLLLLIFTSADIVLAEGFVGFLMLFLIRLCQYSIIVNLTLMAFNILPIYPLDGFRVVEALSKTDNKYIVFMRKYGMLLLLGLMLLGNVLYRLTHIIWLDPLSAYIMVVRNGVVKLFEMMFHIVI